MDQLPLELISYIFLHLSEDFGVVSTEKSHQRQFNTLSLTCRTFNKLAIPFLYRHISLNHRSASFSKFAASHLPLVSQYIRSLQITFDPGFLCLLDAKDALASSSKFIKCCENLERLRFRNIFGYLIDECSINEFFDSLGSNDGQRGDSPLEIVFEDPFALASGSMFFQTVQSSSRISQMPISSCLITSSSTRSANQFQLLKTPSSPTLSLHQNSILDGEVFSLFLSIPKTVKNLRFSNLSEVTLDGLFRCLFFLKNQLEELNFEYIQCFQSLAPEDIEKYLYLMITRGDEKEMHFKNLKKVEVILEGLSLKIEYLPCKNSFVFYTKTGDGAMNWKEKSFSF